MTRTLFAALAISLLAGAPTAATESRRRDPNDTPGPLDIRRIAHGHAGGGALWHKIVTYGTWGRKALQGPEIIRFQFSTDGEDRFDEVNASVDLKDGKLQAWIYPYVEGSDYAGVGPSQRIRLKRVNRRSVKIFFDRSWVDKRDRYAWSVWTSYKDKNSRHCTKTCSDRAPDRGRLVHNL